MIHLAEIIGVIAIFGQLTLAAFLFYQMDK